MWKSVIWDEPEEQDEQGNANPLYEEWFEEVLEEPWFVALQDLVKWTGTWVGTEEQLMEEIRLRVDREVWESEDFPSDFRKLDEYHGIIFFAYRPIHPDLLDYRNLKKKDIEDFDVPGWGPEAPILLKGFAAARPSYRDALYTLLHKYRSPLLVAVLGFTRDRYRFNKKRRSWSGSTLELADALSRNCYLPGSSYLPMPTTPEDPEGREIKRLFEETLQQFNLSSPSDFRRLHERMRTCAYILKEVGIKVSWKKEPWVVKDSEGEKRPIKRTRWTIEAPRWS